MRQRRQHPDEMVRRTFNIAIFPFARALTRHHDATRVPAPLVRRQVE